MGWALLSGDPCKLHSRQREKERKQLAGLSSERETPTRQAKQKHTNKMFCWGVSELTPSVPGLNNGARYPQRTYKKAARSHTDGEGLETGKKKVESHHPSTLSFTMP